MQPMGTIGGTVIGGTSLPSSGLGTSIVPPSNYASNSAANTTYTNPLVSSNPSRILGTDCKNVVLTVHLTMFSDRSNVFVQQSYL